MIATQPTQRLTQGPLPLAALARMLLEALCAVATLYACAAWFDEPFHGSYIILSLLVFSLLFPSHAPRGTSPAALAREVVGGIPLVGWEAGASVDAAVAAGCERIGPLSVWLK